MRQDQQLKMFKLFQTLFNEYQKSDQRCLLEIERGQDNQLIINFLHYHDSYKTNNKLIQIFENKPETHERIMNTIIEVLRGYRKIKKGA